MSRNRWLRQSLRAYPRSWRTRYEEELFDLSEELMDREDAREARIVLGLLLNAPRAWLLTIPRALSPRRAALGMGVAFAGAIAVLFALVVPVNPAASTPIRMTSGAMAPTLQPDQLVQVQKLNAGAQVVLGEIVVFRMPPGNSCGGSPTGTKYVIKRVVGLPRQVVSLADGHVFIDGRRLAEPWLPRSIQGTTEPGPSGRPYSLNRPYRIPPTSYFVLGDNRVDSCDSRYLGPIARSLLVGAIRQPS